MSYSLLHDSELFVAQSKLFGTHCPRTQQAQDVDRNWILSEESRQIKNPLLRFPDKIMLSNHVYSSPKSSAHGEIDAHCVPYETSVHVGTAKTYQLTMTRISWKVTAVEARQRIQSQSLCGMSVQSEVGGLKRKKCSDWRCHILHSSSVSYNLTRVLFFSLNDTLLCI